MVQQRWREGEVPTSANIVGRKVLNVTIVVEWLREVGAGGFLVVLARAVGDKDLTLRRKVLIDANGVRCVDVGRASCEGKVVGIAENVCRRRCLIGKRKTGEQLLRSGTEPCARKCIAWEWPAAEDARTDLNAGGWIKYLVEQDGLIGAGIDQHQLAVYQCVSRDRSAEYVAEVSRALRRSRHGGLNHIAQMQLILLPCEEEEGAILAVVQLGNANRAAKGSPEVVLAVLRLAECAGDFGDTIAVKVFEAIVEPVVGVEDPVFDNRISGSVKDIGSRLDGKTLDTRCRAAKLRRWGRGRDLELLQGLDRGRGFIKGRAVFTALDTGAIEQNFGPVGLTAAQP